MVRPKLFKNSEARPTKITLDKKDWKKIEIIVKRFDVFKDHAEFYRTALQELIEKHAQLVEDYIYERGSRQRFSDRGSSLITTTLEKIMKEDEKNPNLPKSYKELQNENSSRSFTKE